ncbi:MAG: protein kinase [Ktedonobacteraceae bacterium]
MPSSARGSAFALNTPQSPAPTPIPMSRPATNDFPVSGPLLPLDSTFDSTLRRAKQPTGAHTFGGALRQPGPLGASTSIIRQPTGPYKFGGTFSQPGSSDVSTSITRQPTGPYTFGEALSQPGSLDAGASITRDVTPRTPLSQPGSPSGPLSPLREVQRSQVPVRPNRFADPSIQENYRAQAPLRVSRLITESRTREAQPASPLLSAAPRQSGIGAAPASLRPLTPGTLLRGGRYRLQELYERQEWLEGAYECIWLAQDGQRGGAYVLVSELVMPDNASASVQSMLRTATVALTAAGRHPYVPALWDAFSDQGRNFFVFEHMDGENLLSRMRRTGYALAEQEVIECCLQMTDVLEMLTQQSPPLVHGLIRPDHIIAGRSNAQYMLTSFSIVLAGGATQFVVGLDRSRLSPYTAPEFARGLLDGRADLYSLLACAYHLVTGSVPTGANGGIPQAQRLNPSVSSDFEAILAKGLRPTVSQRYQRPSELRRDLLALRPISGSLVAGNSQWTAQESRSPAIAQPPTQAALPDAPQRRMPDSVAQALPLIMTNTSDDDEDRFLLPRPEDLPPMREGHDMLTASIWLVAILICLIAIVVVGRSFI